MKVLRWEEVRERLADLLELPPGPRAAALAAVADPVLRQELEELIEAAEGAGSFLEEAPLSMAGRRIGPYRLTGELGEGGMGVVYLAERADQAFEQKVAVKVLKRGLESTEMQARFRRERQILARLEHPNIARILDGGTTEDGVPWLGMELVDGEPIDQWCNQRRLSVDERLRLFQKVCAAVDYAHRNLVVHRDLKPSNILVTDAGEPKLLDFGIAKVLLEGSDLSETRSGPTAMTPRYASPEQVRGQSVTTASDVYTLGVILYELLTGQAPYTLKTAQPAELERVIGQELPAAPSVAVLRAGSSTPTGENPARLARRLRGDLDTILEKALAKEPERRYASVQQLQEDLDRHLGGLPVLARRDSRGYRLGRFVRRNLPWVLTGSAFMIFLLSAVVVLSLQAQRLRAERDKAREVAAVLKELFTMNDPNSSLDHDLSARELLDRSTSRVEKWTDQPELQAELLGTLGTVYSAQAEYERAEQLLQQAIHLQEGRGESESAEVATLYLELGRVQTAHARLEAARESLDHARRLEAARCGEQSLEVAAVLAELARLEAQRGDYAAAERLRRDVLERRRALLGRDHPEVARAMRDLGVVLDQQGLRVQAEAAYREALDSYRRMGGQEVEEAAVLNNLAGLLSFAGDFDRAAATHQEALELRTRLLGPRHPLVARSLQNLGWVEELRGHPVEARKNLGLALEIREEIYGKDHPESLKTAMLLNQARLLDREPTLGEAMRVFEERRSRLGAEHPDTAHALAILGIAQVQEGFLSAADITLTAAIRLEAQVLGPTQAERAFPYLGLGLLREQQGRIAEAQTAYQQAVDQWNGLLLDNHPWLAWAGVGLHRCTRHTKSPPPAFSPEPLLGRLAADHPLRREWEQIQQDTPVP